MLPLSCQFHLTIVGKAKCDKMQVLDFDELGIIFELKRTVRFPIN